MQKELIVHSAFILYSCKEQIHRHYKSWSHLSNSFELKTSWLSSFAALTCSLKHSHAHKHTQIFNWTLSVLLKKNISKTSDSHRADSSRGLVIIYGGITDLMIFSPWTSCSSAASWDRGLSFEGLVWDCHRVDLDPCYVGGLWLFFFFFFLLEGMELSPHATLGMCHPLNNCESTT